ncbi:16S rRNA (guanine(527)-N(7))-methyltransferase RsmG [Gloeocapsopsis dulcis]|uniref:Ribosomal RNA small subunit methyltransferase G n=1 Tax=Gloeocapsopsis dulcis AAB1 = 1H9 TaxID=1433147 RepID=A0A6N8FWH6_9CHRO|nr:16S rRNA (guanine(527)-N(7))-methyltransferase RsmG [Gloeocapsopsis dulcis]MUL37480.1 16S rRNA (guanine(527)-N(7))-methyltransferase RsmG [Gloeocapsopsis dulcis AAB1 = 1H9]WNN89504.1 16S rRNA (guanine(527)-N(7))-methyltransferase RsmG [Gloeocapsopsis dulcis]
MVTSPTLPQMLEIWQQMNWQPTAAQQEKFQRLYELILLGNRQLNLTRITAPLEFWEKHLWDSLRGIAPLLSTQDTVIRVIDIGTGAGFPGIPVAIALAHSHVTLLDSTRKKITFLDSLLAELSIQNATTVVGRAETINKLPQHHQNYDVALIRAVGSSLLCAEYTLPFLKPNGTAILYRGQWTTEETEALQNKVKQLSGEVEKIEEFVTPLSYSARHCIYLRKVS